MKQQLTDVTQIDTPALPEKEFPGGQRFRISITRDAYDTVWRQGRESLVGHPDSVEVTEVGGVLIGNVYKDTEGPFLEVAAAIVGEHTRNQGTQMTFTPETWAHVNRVKDERYPQLRIVGWYHTHPRFGIFLSDMDKFIHQSHFPQPWTAALVIDPIQETEGFFIWSAGEPRLASEYWVGQERRDQSFARRQGPVSEPAASEPEVTAQPGSAVSRATFALVSVLSFLALLFLFGYVYMREVQHTETEKAVIQALDAQKAELQNSYQALNLLRQELEGTRSQTKESEAQIQQRIQQVSAGLKNVAALADLLQQRVTAQQQFIERIPVAIPVEDKQPTSAPKEKKQ